VVVSSGPPGGGTWTGVALAVGAMLAVLALAFAIAPLHDAVLDAVSGDSAKVREDLRGLGFGGVALVVALAAVHAVVFYPAEILDAAVGYVYGVGWGVPLVMACWLLNAWISYGIGRHAARPLLYKLAGGERFARAERAIERGGVFLLLTMRLIPVIPFSLFSYAAGAARVPLARFTWTTLVGYLPLTAIFVYLGSELEDLSLTDPLLWLSAAALVAMLFCARLLSRRLALDSGSSGDSAGQPTGSAGRGS
jgi:uncharacterized membrane protein YdjX (TVP38/TMEM64 family)